MVSTAMNRSKADEYLTVAEIAGELKLNQQTVRNWIDRGELRAVRAGSRRVRVRRSDLDRMLSEGATAPGPDETATDPLREIRRRLDPALEKARVALAADRKSDLAAASSALVDAAEDAIIGLEPAPTSPPPDTLARQPSGPAGHDAVAPGA